MCSTAKKSVPTEVGAVLLGRAGEDEEGVGGDGEGFGAGDLVEEEAGGYGGLVE
ncbi:MAG: hypothetical protein U0232_24170 [Thermomicrobiales bacterium]